MDDRVPVYAAAAGVLAPVATVRLIGVAIDSGSFNPLVGLAVLFLVPVVGIGWTLSAAWKLGLTGWDPFEGHRDRATVRDDIPSQFHDAMANETLDQQKREDKIPTPLFLYLLCYLVGVPVFALVFLL